jgi:hypothetical protein
VAHRVLSGKSSSGISISAAAGSGGSGSEAYVAAWRGVWLKMKAIINGIGENISGINGEMAVAA